MFVHKHSANSVLAFTGTMMMALLFRILMCSYILFQKHFSRTITDQFKNVASKILFEVVLYFRCGHYKTWSKNTVPYNPSKTGVLFRLYEGHNTQNNWSLNFQYCWRLHQAVPMSKWYAFQTIIQKNPLISGNNQCTEPTAEPPRMESDLPHCSSAIFLVCHLG